MSESCSRIAMSLLVGLAGASGLMRVAHAALGESPASIDTDALALRGAVHSEARRGYAAYEVRAPGGTRLREYVNQSGIVFALSWSGPAPPDLHSWLSAYFADYARALATLAHPGLRRSLRIETAGGAIVEASGHLRAYRGSAYVPAQLPPGCAPALLR